MIEVRKSGQSVVIDTGCCEVALEPAAALLLGAEIIEAGGQLLGREEQTENGEDEDQ